MECNTLKPYFYTSVNIILKRFYECLYYTNIKVLSTYLTKKKTMLASVILYKEYPYNIIHALSAALPFI